MARQNFLGYVVSQGKMNKTIKVRVLLNKFDKKVQKEFLKKKDYLVHDEANICREGDLVRIEQTRPLSARKFFAVAEIKKNKGQQFATYQKEAKINVNNEENSKLKELNNKLIMTGTTLYGDLIKIQDLKNKEELTEEELENIETIKAKYNINTFDKELVKNKEIFKTSMNRLNEKIETLSIDLRITTLLNKLLEDQSKSEILSKIDSKMGVTEETKKNIKKNLYRKFIRAASTEELKDLGLTL